MSPQKHLLLSPPFRRLNLPPSDGGDVTFLVWVTHWILLFFNDTHYLVLCNCNFKTANDKFLNVWNRVLKQPNDKGISCLFSWKNSAFDFQSQNALLYCSSLLPFSHFLRLKSRSLWGLFRTRISVCIPRCPPTYPPWIFFRESPNTVIAQCSK